LYIDGFRYRK
jgi:hypothetical protein